MMKPPPSWPFAVHASVDARRACVSELAHALVAYTCVVCACVWHCVCVLAMSMLPHDSIGGVVPMGQLITPTGPRRVVASGQFARKFKQLAKRDSLLGSSTPRRLDAA